MFFFFIKIHKIDFIFINLYALLYFTRLSVSRLTWCRMVRQLVNNEEGRTWKEEKVTKSKYHSVISVEGIKQHMKKPFQGRLYPERD